MKVKHFRVLGFIEALSLLALLFIAMPMKYLAGMPEATRLAGTVHGVLFLFYFAGAVVVSSDLRWSFGRVLFACLVASIPFGPFVFDRKLFPQNELGS